MSDSTHKEMLYWSEQLAKGRISRREFLGRTLALTAATSLGGFMPSPAAAQEAKKGGFARFGISDPSQQDTSDPATWPNSFAETVFSGSMCNNLTEITPEGDITGDLAESFEPADNARKWVFKLRKGVTFHDGKSLTVDDVIQSFHYHMAPDSTSGAKSLLSQIESIQADGPDSIVFQLKAGSADFPFLTADYHLSIMQAKDGGGIDWQKMLGTGAFVMEHFEPGVSAKMKRNPNYHKDNKPYFDEVEFIGIADWTARLNALATGEVEAITDVDLRNIPLIERNPDLRVERVPSLRHLTFDMDTSVEPYNDPNVRMALKYAMDRDEMIKKVYLGEASKGNDTPVAPSVPFYKNPTPQHDYDIEKAKEYLKKSGLTTVTANLSCYDGAFPGAMQAAALYKEQAAKAGIIINIVREAEDGYWDNVWLKKPFNASDWYGRPTCDWVFSVGYAEDAAWNNTHWKNPRFNELLIAARSETDQAKRAEQYAEMQQIVHDDGGVITVAFANYTYAVSQKIGTGKIGGALPSDNLRMAERWWMA
ncbi:MAG: ABC transporter substrate-binding protein [Rhizobiaceae bacterium]